MIDSTFGLIRAAPTPWSTRAATSEGALQATEQATDASVNTARPSMNMRRRPNLSPSRPAVIRNTANGKPYPAITHSSSPELACSPAWIDASITLTMKKSSTIISVPANTTTNGASPGAARVTLAWVRLTDIA